MCAAAARNCGYDFLRFSGSLNLAFVDVAFNAEALAALGAGLAAELAVALNLNSARITDVTAGPSASLPGMVDFVMYLEVAARRDRWGQEQDEQGIVGRGGGGRGGGKWIDG